MPGFEPPTSGQKLDFTETAYAGLEVTMDAVSIGDLLDLQELAEAASAASVRQLFAKFASHLESWNVTRHGKPVAADLAGVMAQDAMFISAVVQSWVRGLAEAPPPLPGGSPSGGTSAEGSTLGLDAASASLPSSPGQKFLSAWLTGGIARRR